MTDEEVEALFAASLDKIRRGDRLLDEFIAAVHEDPMMTTEFIEDTDPDVIGYALLHAVHRIIDANPASTEDEQ